MTRSHQLVCQKRNVISTVVFTGVIPCTTVSRNLCHVDFQYLIIHADYGIITTYLCHRRIWIPYPPEDSRWDSRTLHNRIFWAELRPIARFDTLLPDYSCQTRTRNLPCQIVGCGTFFYLALVVQTPRFPTKLAQLPTN